MSIWALNPFMTAVLDKILYGIDIKHSHILGMLLVLVCAFDISVSDLLLGRSKDSIEGSVRHY